MPSASERPPPQTSRREGRILIVDDNTELVGSLHDVLVGAEMGDGRSAPRHVEVITASRGDEALAIAKTEGFDVAILDVKLPDTSGVDLIRPLRDACPFSEVVLITGFASMDTAIGALRSGAFAFVPKSFRPEELISTIEQALTKVRLKRDRDELERRYRALVELTDVLVVGIDPAGRVALFNRKASDLAGVAVEDAIGRDFLDSYIPEEDRARMQDVLLVVRSGVRARDVESGFSDNAHGPPLTTVSSKDPRDAMQHKRVRWHLSSAREPAGGGMVYGIGIDVTERRELERRAADAEALSAMGTLALNLAHEIRNPLNAAVLQLHLLGKDVGKLDAPEDKRRHLQSRAQIVGDEIGRLNRLLTEFLELARPRKIARETVRLDEIVDNILELERDSAVAKSVQIVRERSAEGTAANGDPEKLKQVVINLVVNALEAMKSGGTLTVRTYDEADAVILAVIDTGQGIEPEILTRVFDPFFTTKEAGTGLGLSIVRKIVEQHGGEVRIESKRGIGAKVIVRLPKA